MSWYCTLDFAKVTGLLSSSRFWYIMRTASLKMSWPHCRTPGALAFPAPKSPPLRMLPQIQKWSVSACGIVHTVVASFIIAHQRMRKGVLQQEVWQCQIGESDRQASVTDLCTKWVK